MRGGLYFKAHQGMRLRSWLAAHQLRFVSLQDVYKRQVLAPTEVVVQTLECSFQSGYLPKQFPFFFGVPLLGSSAQCECTAVFRCADAASGCLFRKCRLFKCGAAECYLFRRCV